MDGRRKVRAGAVAIVATGALLAGASAAEAQTPPPHLGLGVPSGQSGIQQFNFSNYLGNGAGEITCPAPPAAPTPNCVAPPAPSTTPARLERLFAWLQSK